MLQAQIKTMTVNSGGRITARPRRIARRMGSKTEGDLAAGLDMADGGLELERRANEARARPSPAAIALEFYLVRPNRRGANWGGCNGIAEISGSFAAIEQFRDVQQLGRLPFTMHTPADVHQAAGVGRDDTIGPAGQNALHFVLDHVARNVRIANGERAAE